ncbi:unnamed protein product, partial [Acanthocheilonema viteae]
MNEDQSLELDSRDHTSQNHFCSMYFFVISENATERSRDDVAWRHLQSGKKRFSIQNLVLIVIDSIGAALAFTAWEYFEGGRRVQDEIIAMLHYIARRYGCAIVTTNHFVYWRGKPSPSLGKRWIKAVDFRYLLWKLSNSNYYMQMISPQCHK